MSSDNKLKLNPKYCRVSQYVMTHDEDLAAKLEGLCMYSALSQPVTFLFPQDKAFRKEIVSAEDNQAVKLLGSLIVPLFLPTADSWKAAPEVGSVQGVKYPVLSAAGGKVTLGGEGKVTFTIEKAEDFTLLDKNANAAISVWRLVSGRPPLTGEKFERSAAKARRVKGGGDGEPGLRTRIAMAAELEFAATLRGGRTRTEHPYLTRVCGLLAHLRKRQPALLGALQPLIDWDPVVTFYLFVEPYKTAGGPCMIPDEVIAAWGGVGGFGDCLAAYKAGVACDAKMSPPEAIASRVHAVRQTIFGSDGSRGNKVRLPAMAKASYETLMSKNAIDGASPILPEETVKLVGSAAKKAWQDEMRFLLHSTFQAVRNEPQYNPSEFDVLLDLVRLKAPGNDYVKESKVMDSPLLRSDVAPNFEYAYLAKFINSTDFLYVACPEASVGRISGAADAATDMKVYNRNALALAQLNKMQLAPRSVSAAAIAELQAYYDQKGALPAEVAALAKN